MWSALQAAIGGLLAIPVFLLGLFIVSFILKPVIRLACWIFRRQIFNRQTLVIESHSIREGDAAPAIALQDSVRAAFFKQRQNLSSVRNQLLLRDNSLSYYPDCSHLTKESESIDIQIDMGPVKINKLSGFISWYRGHRDFLLSLAVKGSDESGIDIYASLSKNGILWNIWKRRVKLDDIDLFSENIAREITCIMPLNGPSEIGNIEQTKQSELNILMGIGFLSNFLIHPKSTSDLIESISCFNGVKKKTFRYCANLLSAMAVGIEQNNPIEAETRIDSLIEEYRKDGYRSKILKYNKAIAKFHLYDSQGPQVYDEAIALFKKFDKPLIPLWLYRYSLRFRKSKIRSWLIYLLAQVGITNCLAHKLGRSEVQEDERMEIITDIETKNADTAKALKHLRALDNAGADEIEWRLYNSKAITSLYGTKDHAEGIAAIERGFGIDPDNLPLMANYASLLLLKAQQLEVANNTEERNKNIEMAKEVYSGLIETGWDTCFNNYRLGRVYRLLGQFEEAEKHIMKARAIAIEGKGDVDIDKIEAELGKERSKNDRFE
jgi:tetratricopeptide (TPR) repeat protein